MATNLDLHEATINLQTLFETMWVDAHENPTDVSSYRMWTMLTPSSAKRKVLNTFGAGPTMTEWTGEKKYQQFRHYDVTVDVKNYEKSIALSANDVRYDPSGSIAEKLSAWFGTGGDRDIAKVVWDSFTSASNEGPVGFDGVTLINTAHPHANSGSGESNKGTAALSVSAFDTRYKTMEERKDEAGEYYGVRATHLMVGSENRKMALQIADADTRPLAVDNAGDETGTRIGVAAVTNVFRGWVDVIVNPKCGNDWYLFDLSNPGRLPFGFMTNRGPELISLDKDDDAPRFHRNEVLHSIELDGAPFAGFWPAVDGNIVA